MDFTDGKSIQSFSKCKKKPQTFQEIWKRFLIFGSLLRSCPLEVTVRGIVTSRDDSCDPGW